VRQVRTPQASALAMLRTKYDELWSKHRTLVRQFGQAAADRAGILTLALFAMRTSRRALAIADRKHVLFRNARWQALEHDRTPWRAIARNSLAPAEPLTLTHLAVDGARALLAHGESAAAVARYVRPERGDTFAVLFERIPDRVAVGISIRKVAETPPL
jgi:hypothetical protein